MSALALLLRLFDDLDAGLEHVERRWWGRFAADSRFPRIHDANYAIVETDAPDVTLDEVEGALLPALERSGASHVHVVVAGGDPGRTAMLDQLEATGVKFTFDTVMRFDGVAPPGPTIEVRGVRTPDEALWRLQRRALPEFGIHDPIVIEQLVAWQREVLAPAGKRWFTGHLGDEPSGFGSVHVVGAAAYVDDVVTLPEARRQGVASSIVSQMVAEALAAGARDMFLLADEPGPIKLYEGLGFAAVGEIVGALRPRT